MLIILMKVNDDQALLSSKNDKSPTKALPYRFIMFTFILAKYDVTTGLRKMPNVIEFHVL